MTARVNDNPRELFCALEYRSLESRQERAALKEGVIILIIRSVGGYLRLLVNPAWPSVVDDRDQEYIRSILSDFKNRARFDPDGLMTQTSELSVGPLVTHTVGTYLPDYPVLFSLRESFVEV